jgi:hypothetical protein
LSGTGKRVNFAVLISTDPTRAMLAPRRASHARDESIKLSAGLPI